MKRSRDVLACILLVLAVALLYRKVTRLWWTYDDANMLHTALEHSTGEYFHSAAVWPQKLFTPLVMVWYEAMIALFGLAPATWYVPHLVFFALSAIAFYFALRLYIEPTPACVGALLYVAAVPVCSLITELSGIHYFQAVLLGSLTTIAYVHALRANRIAWSVVSALLYLVAMLAKEIAIPLIAVLLLLPDRDLRARIRFAIPHALAVAIYFAWRYAILGVLLGGYGWAVEDRLALAVALPKKIVLALAGANVTLGIIALAVIAIGVALGMRSRRAVALIVVAIAVAILPALPVSKEMQRRYAFATAVTLCAAFAVGAKRKTALLVITPILAIAANRQEWAHEFGRTQRMADEARFFYDLRDGLIRQPIVPPAAMGELQWLKTQIGHRSPNASWFYDDIVLCESGIAGKRVYGYQPGERMLVELTSDLAAIQRRSCGSIRANAPLRLEFHHRHDALFWTFGPYTEGRWRVLMSNALLGYDVPRIDGYSLPGMQGITLRVRYESPAGWVTYSPEIPLDFVRRPDQTWQR